MSKDLEFEEALNAAGSWGRYQKLLYILVFISCIPNAFVSIHFVFSQYTPSNHCKMPKEFRNFSTNDTELLNDVIRTVIPEGEDQDLSSCQMYDRNYSQFAVEDWPAKFNSSEASSVGCKNGIVYNITEVVTTATIEFSMVCESDWKEPIATAMYYAGKTIGALFGTVADRFGRRPVFLAACALQVGSMVFMSLSWDFTSYCVAVFVSGLAGPLNYLIAFVLVSEVTSPEWRNFMCVGCGVAFSLGYVLIAGIGYWLQQWRWFIAAMALVSAAVYLPSYWLFPESARWLVQRGKHKEAISSLKFIANINKNQKAIDELIEMKEGRIIAENNVASTGIMETLRVLLRSGIRGRFLVAAYCWLVSSIMYFAVSIYSTDFSSNRFLNVLYNGLSEFPAHFLAYNSINLIGRPRSIFLFMAICGFTSIILPFISKDFETASTALAIVGKTAITGVFYVTYIATTEVVPTMQRSFAMSICSACSRVGALLVPYLMYIRKYNFFIPNLIIGLLAISCALAVTFFLPETNGVVVPDNLAAARKNKRFYRFNLLKKFREEKI